ncbi:MAG TPA: Re/Si-specific NAD(P)(+) transhydrogenase subunit alpha [Acidimicrobiales bacterium]|nr:Re/Si-specific NAD(P)(+) transhydrogenase subunit alpha [Acidimicrobiales bacterium]
MRIAVPKEEAGERRVAMTPPVTRRLIDSGHSVVVEAGLGEAAGFPDSAYVEAGAEVSPTPCEGAELILVVGPPTPERAAHVPEDAALVGLLNPFASGELINLLTERRITAFAMEAIPRTTLAQGMDALSSQASAAGYQAVLLAAAESPRIFPMMITAAGTIPPVKVLVLGAGVAGLQAIATARRLGAVVSAYDIRPQVKEQIESLGARFIAAPVDESVAAASGYAKEVSDDTQRRQQAALAGSVADSDVVITTAQIPGRPAPLLISREMVEQMGPGSIIVDVAAPTGGNCELTRPDEAVDHRGVRILGPTDLAGRVAMDASQMYARNLAAFIGRITDDNAELSCDFDDEIVFGACITHDGEITHPVTRRSMGTTPAAATTPEDEEES